MAEAFNLNYNLDGGHEFAGFMTQISRTINSDKNSSGVLSLTHATLANDFDFMMDDIARVSPEQYHHVYEWEELGLPQGRLWAHLLQGRGNSRVASWRWLASNRTVPIPDIPPSKTGKQLKRVHIFVWKAPVMEYDITVHIRPKRGNFLAIPTGDPDNPLHFTRSLVTNPHPGGAQTTGAFTSAFVNYWTGGGMADQAFDSKVRPILEGDLGERMISRLGRKRSRTYGIRSIGNSKAAFELGMQQATTFLYDRNKKYLNMARQRATFFGAAEYDE